MFSGQVNSAVNHVTQVLLWSRTGWPLQSWYWALLAFHNLCSCWEISRATPTQLYIQSIVKKPKPISWSINFSSFSIHRSAIIPNPDQRHPSTVQDMDLCRHTWPRSHLKSLLDISWSIQIPEAGKRLLLCGDLNCPWSDGHINNDQANIFSNYGLCQFVDVLTHEAHLLDVLASDDQTTAYDLQISDTGLVSDNKLLLFKDLLSSPTYEACISHRNSKSCPVQSDSDLFTAPATTAQKFPEQVNRTLPQTLDKLP